MAWPSRRDDSLLSPAGPYPFLKDPSVHTSPMQEAREIRALRERIRQKASNKFSIKVIDRARIPSLPLRRKQSSKPLAILADNPVDFFASFAQAYATPMANLVPPRIAM